MISYDGFEWILKTTPSGGYREIEFGDESFIAVGDDNVIMYSLDGCLNW